MAGANAEGEAQAEKLVRQANAEREAQTGADGKTKLKQDECRRQKTVVRQKPTHKVSAGWERWQVKSQRKRKAQAGDRASKANEEVEVQAVEGGKAKAEAGDET